MTLYNPPHFKETDSEPLTQAIRAQPFATLVSNGPNGPMVSHLPLLADVSEDGGLRLIGHLARPNPHWSQADLALTSLAIFHGPDSYISPGWYRAKQEHGRVVPTWNYSVIHASGRLYIHDDADWLRTAVTRLTDRHERERTDPWAVSDAPEAYIAGQLKGIVGVELAVSRIEGKMKLSQNRSGADQDGVIAGLGDEGGAGSAGVRQAMLGRRAT